MSKYKIIDCHCHIGDYYNFNVPDNSAEGMIRTMDASGIDIAFISSHMSLVGDITKGNDIMFDAINRYPDRFRGYITINPHLVEDTAKDIEKGFKIKEVIGIKIHGVTHKTSILNEGYTHAYEQADKHHKLILIHTGDMETLKAIEELSDRYKNAMFLMGHFGGTVELMKYAMKITNKRDNVYGDTATSLIRQGNVKWLYENAGEGKVLYGSDMPFFDPRPNVGRVIFEDISEAAKKQILSANVEMILDKIHHG